MSMILAEIEAEAMKLSPEEREQLVDVLAASLDGQMELDEAWRAEIARHVAEVESAEDEGIPAEQVFAELRVELDAARAKRQ